MITKTIKHLFTVLLCCDMILATTSCSDFLELDPLNEIVMEQFWNEKADVEGVIASCYSGLQEEAVVKRMMVWGEFRSENIGMGRNIQNDADLEKVLKENIDAKNTYTTWTDFYSVINRCNTVIRYAPGVAQNDPAYTQSELQANLAEMVALRSLCYFYLIRTFRDVPYTTEPFTDDDQDMLLPATPFDSVLDSLITSLEGVRTMAARRYPVTEPMSQTGRITQDAIHAMLCEMYLWKGDYQNCIRYADSVIVSKQQMAKELESTVLGGSTTEMADRYHGYPLVNDMEGSTQFGSAYETLFGEDALNQQLRNNEVIFQLVFSDNPAATGMPANGATNAFFGNASNTIGLVAPSDFVLDDIEKVQGRSIFADRNKQLDARIYMNCDNWSKAVAKYVTRSVGISTTSGTPQAIYGSRYTDGQSGANWIIYRLPDIMLMKAEALTQLLTEGTENTARNDELLAQAFELVDAVNRRSICESQLTATLLSTDYTTKSQMETLVMQERQRELMFEGKRWYDLVRQARRQGTTQELVDAAMRKVTTGGTLIANRLAKMDAIYWPYNNNEVKINPNLKQNPAFSSGESGSIK